ncbi:uncharacterized protein LOC107363486 [Tetranychus urticae]|uniref:Protein sleepless n=1 Tax=Tetranychus urticae TaxID=32264 RepID=T1KFV2_TETUR|nr:uncharacterized protein LOC107363486 [Tetranychus urticae]
MVSFIRKDFNLTFLVTCFLTVIVGKVIGLKCYICDSYSSEPCPDVDLIECPNNQAYDRCLVRMLKTANQPRKVIRECALGPCNFREPAFDNIFKLRQQCDMSKDSYDCVYCCKDDGCNKDSGSSLVPTSIIIIGLLVMTQLVYH